MFLYGGNAGLRSNETFFAYDPNINTWEIVRWKTADNSELNQPPICDEHTAVVYEDCMVVFGGFVEGDRVNSTYKFNFKNGEWRLMQIDQGAAIPCPRAGHSAVADEKYMYIFGGKNNDDEKLNDLWRFDLHNETWQELKAGQGSEIPIGRTGHTMEIYGGHLLIFGGIYETTRELNDCYIYNLEAGVWR